MAHTPAAHALSDTDLRRAVLAAKYGLLLALAPAASVVCACGCDVFDVGTVTMIPSHSGGAVYFEDAYMDQYQNWV